MTIKKILNIKFILTIIFIFLIKFFLNNSFSVEPNEFLKDKKQETRARNISKNIRCVVCQNQSIDDSNAPLAKDLRLLIREKIKDGKNDKEIYKFLTNRYGNFILLKPAFNLTTLALWGLPFIFCVIGLLVVFSYNKKSKLK